MQGEDDTELLADVTAPPQASGTKALTARLPLESSTTANSVSQSSVPKGPAVCGSAQCLYYLYQRAPLSTLSSKKVKENSESSSVPNDKDIRRKEGRK